MRRSFLFAMLASISLTANAMAAIDITPSYAPTLFLPGYITHTLTATVPVGEKLIGFDFVSTNGNYGFFGPMHQLNPAGLPTIFADNNALFPLISLFDFSQDSQFKVLSTDGIAILASESPTSLRAAFNYLPAGVANKASNVWEFVQIAHSAPVEYRGTLTVRNALGVDRLEYISGVLPAVPEPTTLALIALPLFGGYGWIRRRSQTVCNQ